MAWRLHETLMEGELDNTLPGRVTGWMQFAGMKGCVSFDLRGDFHRDIRGAAIRLHGGGCPNESESEARAAMRGFAQKQTGEAGDITAGLPPRDYGAYPYIEWYSDQNGRVVLELRPDQIEVVGRPIPACESDPISRRRQQQHMAAHLAGLSESPGLHPKDPPAS